MECNVYEIDGKNFIEVDTVVIDSVTYLFLSSEDNADNFCIRKVTVIDGIEYLDGLQDDMEFDKVMMHFANKHKNEITSL